MTQARSLPMHVQAAVDRFRSGVTRRFGDRLVDLRLFGSFARGEAWEESDVDVLVLVEDVTRDERDEIVALATDAGLSDEACVVISPFVRSPEQLAERRRRELRIATDIDREGVPL